MRSNLKLGIGLIGLLCVLVLGIVAFANTSVSPNTSATEPAVNGVAALPSYQISSSVPYGLPALTPTLPSRQISGSVPYGLPAPNPTPICGSGTYELPAPNPAPTCSSVPYGLPAPIPTSVNSASTLNIIATPSVTKVATIPASDEVAVGQAYNRPYSLPPLHIKVVRAANPPLITQQTAFQVLGGDLSKGNVKGDTGEPITVEATYGLVTQGAAGRDGSWVSGNPNIHLAKCTIDHKCTFTGEILDHFENRPMWVLVYTGIHEDTHGGIPPECRAQPTVTPCPTMGPSPNHHVYLVDAQTLQYFDGGWY